MTTVPNRCPLPASDVPTTPQRRAGNEQLAGVQCLRGAAALLVVWLHYQHTAAGRGLSLPMGQNIDFGAIGVDIFFVISGFIMELTATRGGDAVRVRDFAARRAIRILPLYWTLTVLAYVLIVVMGAAVNTSADGTKLLKSLLLLPDIGADGSASYIIGVAWSLSYEVYFYVLFAMLLRLPSRQRIAVLAGVLGTCAAIGLWTRPPPGVLYIVTDPLNLEFLLGCVIAALYRQGFSLSVGAGLALAALGMLSLWLPLEPADFYTWRAALWGLPAGALVAAVVLSRAQAAPMIQAPFHYLGDISYSLYLSHVFAIALFVRVYPRLVGADGASPWSFAAGLAAAVLLIAHLCFVGIERPMRQALMRRLSASR